MSTSPKVDNMKAARAAKKRHAAARKANIKKSAANLVIARAAKANGTSSGYTRDQIASMRGIKVESVVAERPNKLTPCKIARNICGYRPFLLNRKYEGVRRSARYALLLGEVARRVELQKLVPRSERNPRPTSRGIVYSSIPC